MNIGALAKATGVAADTLRYYEKQVLLDQPARQDNGYRSYGEGDVLRVRFIRSAQSLGFSLAEIREIIPKLMAGKFGRAEIEQRLTEKMAQIDAHMKELRALKKSLVETFNSLNCSRDALVSVTSATKASASASTKGLRPVPATGLRAKVRPRQNAA